MNAKRLTLAAIAVFAFVFVFDWVLHGMILKNTYIQTASLWRSESEMGQHFGWLVLGQLLLSMMFCLIYALRPGLHDGVGPGIGYGLMVGLLLTGPTLISYAVQPLPLNLIGSWILGGIIQLMIAGALLGAIYRPKPATALPSGQQVAVA